MNKFIFTILVLFSVVSLAAENSSDCSNLENTVAINDCNLKQLKLAKQELAKYLDETYKHRSYDPILVETIKSSQKAWEAYLESHCHAISTLWSGGTFSNTTNIYCVLEFTRQRTHLIWESFLTHMDTNLQEPML